MPLTGWQRLKRTLGISLKLRDPPNVPPYGWSYFDHLVAVFLTLNAADPRAEAVIKKASDNPDALTWGDIFLFENVIFSLQPPEVIERNAWVIRERFRETAGATMYDKYAESSPPKDFDTPAKLELLKADLRRVLDILHWHYALIPIREHIRKSLTIYCIWMVLIYTVGLLIALHIFRPLHWDFLAMLLCVLYFGIIGGFVSSQRRMQAIPVDIDPLISIFGLDSAGYFLWLSPLLGAIFAAVLTLMFIAGILKGTIFPEFLPPFGPGVKVRFFDFIWHTTPGTSEDYAKLFVWAFLAGFAERLVPDSLDRLTAKLAASKQSNGAPPPASTAPVPPGPAPGGPNPPKPPVTPTTISDALRTGIEPSESRPDEGAETN